MIEKKTDLLSYYAQPGRMTDPGPYADLLIDLPTDLPSLVKVVQGNLLHIFWAQHYGVQLSEERQKEASIRPAAAKLARLRELGAGPLTRALPPAGRLVGNCRDFTVLLTTFLRGKNIPARARAGFGVYFTPNHFEDHWVCEYWNREEERWVLVDAQLDELQCEVLAIDFDPLDMPRDRFVTGGQAWEMCRFGGADPRQFGIFDMNGMDFVWGNVAREFLAFNKVEILPWDGGWGVVSKPWFAASVGQDSEVELSQLDEIAALTVAGDAAVDTMRAMFAAHPGWNLGD